jgi:hypothetical protein
MMSLKRECPHRDSQKMILSLSPGMICHLCLDNRKRFLEFYIPDHVQVYPRHYLFLNDKRNYTTRNKTTDSKCFLIGRIIQIQYDRDNWIFRVVVERMF